MYNLVSGYVRDLDVPAQWQGRTLLLTFGAAAHEATVYINGAEAGTHSCGYTAFSLDISGLVRYGQTNRIAVRLDSRESLNIPPFGFVIDYMTYGGIYRDVYLDVRHPEHIRSIFIAFFVFRRKFILTEQRLDEITQILHERRGDN